jgi:outer membrane protein assembly factor BamB
MKSRRFRYLGVLLWCCALGVSSGWAQSGQWTTYGHDPQRSGWAIDEHAFSASNVSSMGLVWKTILPNEPRALNGLTAPLVITGVHTQEGERNVVIVAGSSDDVYGLDAESGKLIWQREVGGEEKPPSASTWLCPAALNATPVVDAANARLFVVSSDGRLHTLALGDGHSLIAPAAFVPPFSKMWSLNYDAGFLYTSISQDCNNAHSGIVGLDPDSPGRPVVTFYSADACGQPSCGAGIWGRGGPSIDSAGLIYAATGDAGFAPDSNLFGDTILKLSPRTLQLKGYFTPSIWEYLNRRDLDMGTSTPVHFNDRGQELVAVGGKEGAIYLVNAGAIETGDHHSAVYISPRYTNKAQTFEANGIWGGMSVWADSVSGTWLYVPSWGEPTEAAKFPHSYGPVQHGSIMAFGLENDTRGKLVLAPRWMSHDIAVPDPVAVAGGLVFVLGTGENPMQVRNGDIEQALSDREKRNSGHAILYALDAQTGKDLWSSENTITGWTHFSGLAVGDGKVYVTTHDGAVYAFALRGDNAPAAVRTVVARARQQERTSTAVPSNVIHPANLSSPECREAGEIFQKRCSMCHGVTGEGIPSVHTPNFADPSWQAGKNDAVLLDAIASGKSGGMPAFGNEFDVEQINRLLRCVVRSFDKSKSTR